MSGFEGASWKRSSGPFRAFKGRSPGWRQAIVALAAIIYGTILYAEPYQTSTNDERVSEFFGRFTLSELAVGDSAYFSLQFFCADSGKIRIDERARDNPSPIRDRKQKDAQEFRVQVLPDRQVAIESYLGYFGDDDELERLDQIISEMLQLGFLPECERYALLHGGDISKFPIVSKVNGYSSMSDAIDKYEQLRNE